MSKPEQKIDTDSNVKDKKINKIAILYAMMKEANPLIDRLKLKESKQYSQQLGPFPVYTNDDETIFCVVNGKDLRHKCDRVGTQWAALCAYLTIDKISPDLIINAGTCGGIVPKYCFDDAKNNDDNDKQENEVVNIADVFIGQKAIYSDRRVPIPQFQPWDSGHYELFGSQYLNKQIKSLKIAKCFASSNAFDYTVHDQQIYKKEGVVCKDMECAAIAEMCANWGCKLIALKGVTDLVAHHDANQFLANLTKTVSAVTDITEMVVKEVMGKQLSDIENI